MKKRLSFLLILIMALSLLAACGNKETPNDDPIDEPPDSGNVSEPADPDVFVPDGNINPLTGLCDGISDEALATRPIAIMVSNSYDSLPQWGISQADIIYEMLAEGRISRFLAIFKDPSKIDKLASIRSARPYFIDIAQSYGAVYIHFGGSVPAYNAIKQRKELISIDGISGNREGTVFFRDPDRRKSIGLEHSVFTTGEYLEYGLSTLSADLSQGEQPSAFKFSDRYSENGAMNGEQARKVTITYSARNMPWFEYNEDNGTYMRFQYGDPHMDAYKEVQLEVKNLIVIRMKTTDVPNSDLKLVDIKTTGRGDGFYFCDGKHTPITWTKSAYNSEINYYGEDGQELVLARGTTFVSVITETASLDIE